MRGYPMEASRARLASSRSHLSPLDLGDQCRAWRKSSGPSEARQRGEPRPESRVGRAGAAPYDGTTRTGDLLRGLLAMAEFAARVLKLVAEPDYKPITLKAMSRRFEVDRRRLRRVPRGGQGAGQGGEARPGQGQDAAQARSGGADRRRCSAARPRASGSSGRTPTADRSDQIYIPPDASGDASSGDEVAVKITKRPRRPGMNARGPDRPDPRAGLGHLRRHLLRGRRRRLRQDRRHDVPRADLRRRPRRQGGQAGRQGRPRDGPLPDALPRRRGGHHRDPRPARPAGGRYPDGHPRVQHPRHLRRGRPRRGPRAGQAVRRSRDRRAARPPRRPDA